MNILIAGYGNVATVLGRMLYRAGHNIVGVAGRNKVAAKELAKQLGSRGMGFNEVKDLQADLVLLALSDTVLNDKIPHMEVEDAIWAHTAGSVSMEVLKGKSPSIGVFYPLQSLNKNAKQIPEVPILIDGNSNEVREKLNDIASSMSHNVMVCNDKQRIEYHLNAVIVSNFVNHLYRTSQDRCGQEGLDFGLLQPLIEETAIRLRYSKAAAVQTGPAVRNDTVTIEKHLELLQDDPALQQLYKFMTSAIQQANANDKVQ